MTLFLEVIRGQRPLIVLAVDFAVNHISDFFGYFIHSSGLLALQDCEKISRLL